MVPDKFNMVDMDGIDLIMMQGEEVPGLYLRLVESIAQCRYQCLYNWFFDGVVIPPTYVKMEVNEDDEVEINEGVTVSPDDVIHIYSIERDPDIIPLLAEENGVYNVPSGVDGFNPVTVDVPSYTPVISPLTITENGTYTAPPGVDGYGPVVVNVSNIKYAGDAYFGDYEGTNTSSLSCTITGAVGAYAVLVIMHRASITLPSGWTLVDNRVNPKTAASGNINQEISIYKKQMASAQETVVISQASSARMCATSFIFGSDVNIIYLQTLEMDDYSTYRYTVPHQNGPVLFCMSNVYSGSSNANLSPANLTIGKNGAFSKLESVTIRQLASIINSPIDSIFLLGTTAGENDKAVNRAYLYSLS